MTDTTHDPASPSSPQMAREGGCDLEALERLLEKATPGPWEARCLMVMAGYDRITHTGGNLPPPRANESEANAALIAAATTALPALIAEIRGYREALEKLKADLAEEERGADLLVTQRDRAEAAADKLAAIISSATGVYIGEHSNLNDPWQAAIELEAGLLALKAAGTSDPGNGGIAATASETQQEPKGPVNCNNALHRLGKACPRTCERCRLGPCPFYNNDGSTRLARGEG